MSTLTDQELDLLAQELPLIKAWVSALENFLTIRLQNGAQFSHVKLTPKQGNRKWSPDTDPIALLTQFSDLDKVAPRSALSPSQAEKILGKEAYRELAKYVVRESSGTTLTFVTSKD